MLLLPSFAAKSIWVAGPVRSAVQKASGPHPFVSVASGSLKWNVAPVGEASSYQSSPPWALIIARQIESPTPIPSGLVVTNG